MSFAAKSDRARAIIDGASGSALVKALGLADRHLGGQCGDLGHRRLRDALTHEHDWFIDALSEREL